MFYKLKKSLITTIAAFIPIKKVRKATREKWLKELFYEKKEKIIQSAIQKIKNKTKNNQKIKVAFLVIFDSVFPLKLLFEEMLNSKIFEPYILVIPDTSRGNENMFYQMEKTYKTLSQKYKNVYKSYNETDKKFIDYTDNCDLACFANPYDHMTHELFTIEYAVTKKILPIYSSYGFMSDYYAQKYIINLRSLNLCWKVVADTQYNYDDIKNLTDLKGKNTIFTGYAKMDELDKYKPLKRTRKRIIIAPHHTVDNKAFPLSNFMEYAQFFLELPDMYPDIDFVFRPHPLLFVTLAKDELWGKAKVQEYIEKMKAHKNVEYQNGGEYFETFVNSDGLIHDCSSFLVEYLYVNKPCCYLLKDKNEVKQIFTEFGQTCLDYYYKAFNKENIIDFIENIIIKENDTLEEERNTWVNENIKINYPNVTKKILEIITEELL